MFYRLVGAFQFPKDEKAYDRLQETLNRARMTPINAIRDTAPPQPVTPSGTTARPSSGTPSAPPRSTTHGR